jgi:drug/metabolite transporter (DMT)-like permease
LAIGLKYALHFTSTGTIVWVRMVFAFFMLLAYLAWRSPSKVKTVFKNPPTIILMAGLLLAFNYFGYMRGLELTTASNAQIMIQLGPLALLFIGVFYFKERLRLVQWLGIIVAGVGFVFYNWDQMIVSLKNVDQYILGNIWIFWAGLTWALFAAFQKVQFKKGWSPQMINLLVYFICLLALFPTATVSELYNLDLWQWFILFLLGLNTLVAYGAFAEAMNLIPASYVSLIVAVNPLLTIFLVGLFDHFGLTFISPEPIHWRGYLGAALVVVGVGIAVSLRARTAKS